MHSDDQFDTEVTVNYDLTDATASVAIDLFPHNGAEFDLQHMAFVEGLRESITTYCQLHHYYRQEPDLLMSSERAVSAVQYYVELAFAHAMIDALGEERARTDLTRRVLLLDRSVECLEGLKRSIPRDFGRYLPSDPQNLKNGSGG